MLADGTELDLTTDPKIYGYVETSWADGKSWEDDGLPEPAPDYYPAMVIGICLAVGVLLLTGGKDG